MKQVRIEERTKIEGVYCPFSGGLCRMNCRFLIDVEEGCMIEQGCRNLERIREALDEMQDGKLKGGVFGRII